jgi:hypothetical protein
MRGCSCGVLCGRKVLRPSTAKRLIVSFLAGFRASHGRCSSQRALSMEYSAWRSCPFGPLQRVAGRVEWLISKAGLYSRRLEAGALGERWLWRRRSGGERRVAPSSLRIHNQRMKSVLLPIARSDLPMSAWCVVSERSCRTDGPSDKPMQQTGSAGRSRHC